MIEFTVLMFLLFTAGLVWLWRAVRRWNREQRARYAEVRTEARAAWRERRASTDRLSGGS